ncbi:MAG TPA: zinc ribbon domain-containing protein [Anaerolineaceae bacterium]|nr:zinc ribbon domain-containing protein [Anaerolineaceae bacterium]HPN52686.1 zinc ribbon domain-containing protein [Anaerolineaceae bacterium]
MPSYEFRCLDCHKRFEKFMSYQEYDRWEASKADGSQVMTCPHCKSANVQRKIGRIRVLRSNASRMEDFSDISRLDALEDDPVALGQMMREAQDLSGEEMPPEFDEVVHRLEAGQPPDQIEKDMPELSDGGKGMDSTGDLPDGLDY